MQSHYAEKVRKSAFQLKDSTEGRMISSTAGAATESYRGTDNFIVGIVLAVITFWLFAQTMLNIASTLRNELQISESLSNIAVNITALFSGIFIVVAGGRADR
jgi:DHA2 family multidrug resistance protein-like MFS transporter